MVKQVRLATAFYFLFLLFAFLLQGIGGSGRDYTSQKTSLSKKGFILLLHTTPLYILPLPPGLGRGFGPLQSDQQYRYPENALKISV